MSATLLANTGPIFTSLISRFSGQGAPSVVLGLLISVFGIIFVQWPDFTLGIIRGKCFLLSGFCIAIHICLHQKYERHRNILYEGVYFFIRVTMCVIAERSSIFSFSKNDIVWFVF